MHAKMHVLNDHYYSVFLLELILHHAVNCKSSNKKIGSGCCDDPLLLFFSLKTLFEQIFMRERAEQPCMTSNRSPGNPRAFMMIFFFVVFFA